MLKLLRASALIPLLLFVVSIQGAETLPPQLSDQALWKLIEDGSEPTQQFPPQHKQGYTTQKRPPILAPPRLKHLRSLFLASVIGATALILFKQSGELLVYLLLLLPLAFIERSEVDPKLKRKRADSAANGGIR